MKNSEIVDKIYYLTEESITKNRNPDFFYCNIIADKTHFNGDIEQFNEYVLHLMSEFSKDKLVECFICDTDNAEKYFVPGKMITGIHIVERIEGWIFKKKKIYKNVATLSKDNEFTKFSNRVYKYESFSMLIFPYEEINFDENNSRIVTEYADSKEYIFSILPEIINPECWIEVNTKYISKEEFIRQLTKLTEATGRKLEVEI